VSAPGSLLDRELILTLFADVHATAAGPLLISLRGFADRLRTTTAPAKVALPLFSAGRFGRKRTAKNSLRHDANVTEIAAVVIDYDAGRTSLADAAEAFRKARLAALLVTSPSYTTAAPRWRAILPLTQPLTVRNTTTRALSAHYGQLVSRVAGILPDAPGAESWTLSQSWYLGGLADNPDHGVLLLEDGNGDPDTRTDLDATARPKPPPAPHAKPAHKRRAKLPQSNGQDTSGAHPSDPDETADDPCVDAQVPLADALHALGDAAPGIHQAALIAAGKLIAAGNGKATVEAILRNALERRPEAERDDRWRARYDDVARIVDWAAEREAEMNAALASAGAHNSNGTTTQPSVADGSGNGSTPPPPTGGAATPQPGPGPQPPDLDLDASVPLAYTHEALALRFAERHLDRLRFVAAWNKWMLWADGCWRADDTLRAFSLTRLLLRQASATVNKRKIAQMLGDARTVAAVERLARADRRLTATTAQWDADLHLLNTPAGIVDLHDGTPSAHRLGAFMTRITAAAPGGDCPRWRRFLGEITAGDQDLQAYLQRVAGYCLSGSTREHALFFGWGTGGNGKGTFLNVLSDVYGDYAAVADMTTFTQTAHERHPCDLAALRGARLVTAGETEEGQRWAESRIKQLTGGDPVSARFMRQEFFAYTPTYKLFLTGNHRPGLRSVDPAIRRRLHLIPFPVHIPLSADDRRLRERLRREWGGILAWAIAGCLAWQRQGLAPPAAVTDTTNDYLGDEDVVTGWIAECCEPDPQQATYASVLFTSFASWLDDAKEFPRARRWLVSALQDRGYRRFRDQRAGPNSGQIAVAGLALKSRTGTVLP
jgi:putative DNA primase/helicase